MSNPYDPHQDPWQGGQSDQGGAPWNQQGSNGQQPHSQQPQQPYSQQYPQQQGPQGQPPLGWQPGGPPTQAFPPGQPPYGGQPPVPPPGAGSWGPMGPGGQPPPRRTTLWVTLAVVVVLIAAGLTTWLVLSNKSDNSASPGPTNSASQPPPALPSSDGTTSRPSTESEQGSTSEQSTAAGSTTAGSTTAGSTTAGSTSEQSTAAGSTTTQPSSSEPASPQTSAVAAKVKVGDCVHIEDAARVDLNEAGIACSDPSAVYKISVIGTSKTACDKNEANWLGTVGGLKGKTLCLLPELKLGDCFQTTAATNGDYQKVPCAKAKAGNTKVTFASTTTSDPKKCAANTTPYAFPKRKVLFCFAPIS